MKISEIRLMLDLIKRLLEENPPKIEQDELSKEEIEYFEKVKAELTKKKFVKDLKI